MELHEVVHFDIFVFPESKLYVVPCKKLGDGFRVQRIALGMHVQCVALLFSLLSHTLRFMFTRRVLPYCCFTAAGRSIKGFAKTEGGSEFEFQSHRRVEVGSMWHGLLLRVGLLEESRRCTRKRAWSQTVTFRLTTYAVNVARYGFASSSLFLSDCPTVTRRC